MLQLRSKILVFARWTHNQTSHVEVEVNAQARQYGKKTIQSLLLHQAPHREQRERALRIRLGRFEVFCIDHVREEIEPAGRNTTTGGVANGPARIGREHAGQVQIEPASGASALQHVSQAVAAHRADGACAQQRCREANISVSKKMLALKNIRRILAQISDDADKPLESRRVFPHPSDRDAQVFNGGLPEFTAIQTEHTRSRSAVAKRPKPVEQLAFCSAMFQGAGQKTNLYPRQLAHTARYFREVVRWV